jgi:hypothetical protein
MLFSAHFFYTPIAEFQTKKRGRAGAAGFRHLFPSRTNLPGNDIDLTPTLQTRLGAVAIFASHSPVGG